MVGSAWPASVQRLNHRLFPVFGYARPVVVYHRLLVDLQLGRSSHLQLGPVVVQLASTIVVVHLAVGAVEPLSAATQGLHCSLLEACSIAVASSTCLLEAILVPAVDK